MGTEGWSLSPLGFVVGTEGSIPGRRVNPESTGQARPDLNRSGSGADCWAGPVISKPDIALGWKEHAGFFLTILFI